MLAFRDGVTGLPSRDLLEEMLLHEIECARRERTCLGLLYADIDNFKATNQLLGRPPADALLRLAGERMRAALRACDVVGRVARDEFAVIARGTGDAAAILVAEKVRAACTGWYQAGGREHALRVSVGSSVFPHDGETVDALFRRAEASMLFMRGPDRAASAMRRLGSEYVLPIVE